MHQFSFEQIGKTRDTKPNCRYSNTVKSRLLALKVVDQSIDEGYWLVGHGIPLRVTIFAAIQETNFPR